MIEIELIIFVGVEKGKIMQKDIEVLVFVLYNIIAELILVNQSTVLYL